MVMYWLRAFIQLARPHHYVKNGFIFLPLFFGYKLTDRLALLQALCAFVLFSLTASAVYIFNDMRDVNEDRDHPLKKNRPLASGVLSISSAAMFLVSLLLFSFSVSLVFLPKQFAFILAAYVLLNSCYSFYLKHFAIIDVVCVATGFVLRVLAGGIVAEVPVSHWIVIMTFLLATFLALGKRRDDILLSACGHNARKSLSGYNLEFVSSSMVVMTSVTIVAYLLYCVSPEVIERHGTKNLYLTGFWVILGFLRYLQIAFVQGLSGSPTLILLKDPFLWVVLCGWLLTFYWLIYGIGH